MYKLPDTQIQREAFAPATETETTEIRSALPASKSIQLRIAAVSRSLLRPYCFAELAAATCGSPK